MASDFWISKTKAVEQEATTQPGVSSVGMFSPLSEKNNETLQIARCAREVEQVGKQGLIACLPANVFGHGN